MPKPIFANNVNKFITQATKINFAGEWAAVLIYSAQYKKLLQQIKQNKAQSYKLFFELKKVLKMREDELQHLQYFTMQMRHKGINPSVFMSLWTQLAELLAKASMKYTSKTGGDDYLGIMLSTKAVEEEIIKHYQNQVNWYKKNKAFIGTKSTQELFKTIEQFLQDETDHFDDAAKQTQTPRYFDEYICQIIAACCRAGIYLSKI